jgi:hypothetical protein
VLPPQIDLQLRHLDLSEPPTSILDQLGRIADEIAGRVRQRGDASAVGVT